MTLPLGSRLATFSRWSRGRPSRTIPPKRPATAGGSCSSPTTSRRSTPLAACARGAQRWTAASTTPGPSGPKPACGPASSGPTRPGRSSVLVKPLGGWSHRNVTTRRVERRVFTPHRRECPVVRLSGYGSHPSSLRSPAPQRSCSSSDAWPPDAANEACHATGAGDTRPAPASRPYRQHHGRCATATTPQPHRGQRMPWAGDWTGRTHGRWHDGGVPAPSTSAGAPR